jgi:hypothetical protein
MPKHKISKITTFGKILSAVQQIMTSQRNLTVLYIAMIHMIREILCLIKISFYTDFAVLNRKIILISSIYKNYISPISFVFPGSVFICRYSSFAKLSAFDNASGLELRQLPSYYTNSPTKYNSHVIAV